MVKKLVEYFIKHSAITNWIMIVILIGGVFALANLNRRIDPRIELHEIEINVPYPGASAREVEEGITIKIEENLRGIEGIEKITSTSSDGWASINVEITQGYDMNKAIQDIKNSVNSINSYPTGAEKPVVYQETMWNRAIMLTIHGPEDLFTLKKIVEEFRDELLATGKISNVMWWGTPDREFSIEVSPEDLRRNKITIAEIASAVRGSNLDISSGSVLTENQEILIRSYNKKYEASELEKIEVISSIDGNRVLLRDIATVQEQWPENRFYSEYNGKRSVGFNVMYNNNEDVIEIVEITERIADEFTAKYQGLVEFNPLIKRTDELEERIDLMTQNGLIGLVLVIVVLTIFLNSRLAFWVALGIPISLMGMFFVLLALGITINEMSLFGMIMVIGILVDDGIIIGESIYSQWQQFGKPPLKAAIDGTLDVLQPVSVSILTTIVAFTPYFYFYGVIGDHVWQIAAVVIISVLFSLIEAAIILPAHIAHSKAITNEGQKSLNFFTRLRKRFDVGMEKFVNGGYGGFLKMCLNNRWAVNAGMVAVILLIIGLFAGSHVRAQFFPALEPPFTRVEVEVPAGISAEVADKIRDDVIAKSFEFGDKWAKDHEGGDPIINFTSWMNGGTINIFFVIIGSEYRDYTIGQFSDALSEYIGDFPEAESVMVGGWSFGGNPISVKLQSQDYTQLLKAKDLLKAELRKIDGVKDIQDNTPLGNNEFIVSMKPKGHALGFTVADLTGQLRDGFYGREVMRLQRGRDEMKMWVRFTKKDRIMISQIENLKVRTPQGEFVPFKEVAEYRIERSLRRIRHEEGKRSITVFANLDYEKNDLNVVLQDLDANIVPSVLSQVEGVKRSYGGQSEEVGRFLNSVQFTMGIAIVIMFTILMFLLKSYLQTMLIMSLIPLGIIGAVIGHYIVGIPISILSFLGIVALAGIIINDSVVLVDKYNRNLAEGMKIKDALYQASIARFRPIVLTTITTCAGLAPIIFLKSEQGQFLVPMAVSVAFGLLFGTFLTLLMLPAALYSINDIRKVFSKKKTRLELEPAYANANDENEY